MSDNSGSRRQFSINRALAVAAVTATMAVILWSSLSLGLMRYSPTIAFDGDEALFAMWGAAIYLDLAHGDLSGLLRHSYAQNRYPFFYSYFQVPVLALLGITPFAHRLVGIIFMVALCASVYLCVVWSRPGRNSWVGGCLTALLVIACPTLHSVASRVYIEPAGLVLMMLTYALYLRAQATQSTKWAWGAGLLHLVLWFTKWQFGILVTLVLVTHILIRAYPHWRKAAASPVVRRVLLPAWVTVVLWLANPYQLREFVLYLTYPEHRSLLQGLVRGFLGELQLLTGAHFNGTNVAALFTIAGLLYGLCRLRQSAPLLFVLGALVAAVATTKTNPEDAYSFPKHALWLLPPLWVLAGVAVNAGISRLLARLAGWSPLRLQVGVSLLVVLLLAGAIGNAALGRQRGAVEAAEGFDPNLWRVLDYVVETVPPTRRITTPGCWPRRVSTRALLWAYLAEYGPAGLGYDDLQLWDYPSPDPHEKDVLHLRWPWRIRLPAQSPPPPPPDPVTVLRRADIDPIIACSGFDEPVPPEESKVIEAATSQLGFVRVREFTIEHAEWGLRVFIYWPRRD